ncbi:PH domain-containing protein [Lawsonella clevelandensis]|uniref:PH domain-containing protein n=1 Tax=Lawsonella clevelandensis TaxID=1528099 RepID=UPI0006B5AA68|nr:PH domain-containing protein [Lawsonella clevelandensis]
MPSDTPIRYEWSPNIAWRIAGIVVGAFLFALSFMPNVSTGGKILLILAAFTVVWNGLAGLIRRPRLVITDTNLHVRRTFRDHVYPLYSIHGFRIDRPSGIIQRFPMLTFDIARVEDWADLRTEFERQHTLPLPLPAMENRQRDTLEVLTWGDIGVNPLGIATDLEEAGIRNLNN